MIAVVQGWSLFWTLAVPGGLGCWMWWEGRRANRRYENEERNR